MPKHFSDFILAAGFLTRLAPARIADDDRLGSSLRWFPLVGLFLGIGLVAPWYFGVLGAHPWVQAWMWMGLAMYATRGLHWDGWADLWDAWGSGVRGDRFWEVLKDSRMGAFGGMGLFMGLAGSLVMVQEICREQQWGVLVFAPVLGRCAAVVLAWLARDLQRPGLAGAFLRAADARCLGLVLGQTLLLGVFLVPWKPLVLAALIGIAGLSVLRRLGSARGGLNGDFLGAAIVWGEISVLLAWIAAKGA